MARRKDSPQKAAMREVMRDMMSVLLEVSAQYSNARFSITLASVC